MPNNVDTRIVEMEFDNTQFERGAKQTLKTLDTLNQSLSFENVAKGAKNLESAFNKLDFTAITNNIDLVGKSFTGLEAVAFGVSERIGNKIADLGTNIANELLVAQKKAGFGEYELELGSVQTIQASTGEQFDKIYGYLAELNKYADQTIYSFSDMTSSIGKFTNAGVELGTAVKAIQGISNEAALSGANANEASRAMYNFAQALSSGAVRLIDWKSIENANMATVEFKQQLLDTAVAMGTVVKQGDKYVSTTTDMRGSVSDAFDATSGFNDSLGHFWMTTDVLTATLARYSDETTELGKRSFAAAQDVKSFTQLLDTLKEAIGSGWAETFRLIFGEFEDAKKLWTGVSNVLGGVIDRFSDLRNHALRYWKQEGGRTKLLNSLIRLWKIFEERVKVAINAFSIAFPIFNKTGHVLMNLTKRFQRFTINLKKQFLGNAQDLTIFSNKILDVLSDVKILATSMSKDILPILSWLFRGTGEVINALMDPYSMFRTILHDVIGEVSKFTAALSEMFWSFDSGEPAYAVFYDTILGISYVLQTIRDLVIGIIRFATKNVEALYWITDSIRSIAEIVISVFGQLSAAFGDIFIYEDESSNWFSEITKNIAMFLRKLSSWVKGSQTVYLLATLVFKILKGIFVILKSVAKGVSSIFNPFGKKGQKGVYSFLDAVINLVDRFVEFISQSHIIEKAIAGIGSAFIGVAKFIKGLTGKSISENLIDLFDFLVKIESKIDFEAVGRRIRKMGDKIVDALQYIWENVLGLGENSGPRKLLDKIQELKEKFDEGGQSAEEAGKEIRTAFDDTKENIKQNVDKIKDFLEELLRTIKLIAKGIKKVLKSLGGTVAEGIVTIVTGLVDEKTLKKIEESETFIGDLWIKLKEIAKINGKGLGGDSSLHMDNLKDKLKQLYEGLKDCQWLIGLITDMIFKLKIASAIATFAKGVKSVGDGANNLAIAVKSFSFDIGKSLKRFMKAKQIEAFGALLVSISAAFLTFFAIVVGVTALFEFGGEDTVNTFKKVLIGFTVAIVLVGVAIAFLLHKLDKMSRSNNEFVGAMEALSKVLYSIAAILLSFAISVAILGAVYKSLDGGEEFGIILGSLIAMLAVTFGLLLLLLSETSKNDNIRYGLFDAAEMFRELSKVLVAMGVSMILMSAAMMIISKIDGDTFWRAFAVIFAFFAMVLVLIDTATKSSINSSGNVFEGLSKTVTSMGLTLIMLAVALKLITQVVAGSEPEELGVAVGIVGLFMALLATMVVLGAKYANPASIDTLDKMGQLATKLAGAMILLSIAVGIIGLTFKMLKEADIDTEYLWMLFGIVAIMGVVLGALGALANVVPGGAVTYLVIAAALVVLASAIALIVYALHEMQDLDLDSLAGGLKTMGQTSGWIALLGLSMIVLGVGALTLALGLGLLTIPLLILWPIVKAFLEYWPSIQEMFKGASEGTDKLSGSINKSGLGASIGEKLGAGLRDLVKSLKKYAPEIINDITDIVGLIVQAFFAPLAGIGKGLIDTLVIVLGYVDENLGEILGPLGRIITKLLNFITIYAPMMAELIARMLVWVLNGAFLIVAEYAGELASAIYEAVAALLEAFADVLSDENNTRIAVAVARIVDGLFDLIGKIFDELGNTKMADVGSNLIIKMVDGIKNAGDELKKAFNEALGIDVFKIDKESKDSDKDWWYDWDEESGQYVWNQEKYEKHLLAEAAAAEQEAQEAAKEARAEEQKKAALEANKEWRENMEQQFKDQAAAAEEVTKKGTEEVSKAAEKGAEEGSKDNKLGDVGEKIKGAFGESAGDIDFESISGSLKDTFDVSKFIPNSEEMTSGFTNSFAGMPDVNAMMTNAGVDTSVELEPVYDMDNAKIMQDGQLSDFEGFDSTMLMGETSTDYSQTVSQTQNTEFNDETKATYEKLKTAVDDLTAMLSNVTIISDDATISASVDLDGEKVGELMVPVVDAKLTQGGKKAKAKTAQ